MFDAVTYGAAVGAAKRYTDEHSGSDDAVKYTEQSLTSEQQAQARENIGAAASTDIPTDAVKYTAQTLTAAQKSQARQNIGASDGDYRFLTNTPPLVKGSGTGGNTVGGTGVNSNTTRYTNSVAYGNITEAAANYAFAFGEHAFAGVYSRNTGKHAVAIGKNVRAEKDYEWAIGKFNQSNADTAFSIGDGTSDSDKHNLMELKADGTLLLNGNAVKTEGGDDNKLRLGQITANGKYGIGNLFSITTNSTAPTFLTTDVPFNLSTSTIYKFGDFYAYSSSGIKIAPIAGYTGISKTGQWIHAENCYAMFYNCNSNAMTSFDVSMLDTSEVKNMGYMFSNCTKLTSLDLSTFDTSNVEDMSYMFFDCEALTSLDLSGFDTSKVQNMHMMFYNCKALTSLNLSGLDTSEVTDMYDLFYGCSALTTIDLSSFDMTNVTTANFMFGNGGSASPVITTLKTPKINPLANIPLPRTLYSQDGTAYTKLPVTTGTSIELRQSWT